MYGRLLFRGFRGINEWLRLCTGGVPKRLKGAVSKTASRKRLVSSNLTPSAKHMNILESNILMFIIVTLLLVGEIVLFYMFFRFFRKMDKLFGDTRGRDILKIVAESIKRSNEIERDIKRLFLEDKRDKNLARTMFRKMDFVRFNPFGDMGGEQSFVMALLDSNDDGVILTSMHGKDGTRVYAKNIKNGKSVQQLSREEEKSLQQAVGTKGKR